MYGENCSTKQKSPKYLHYSSITDVHRTVPFPSDFSTGGRKQAGLEGRPAISSRSPYCKRIQHPNCGPVGLKNCSVDFCAVARPQQPLRALLQITAAFRQSRRRLQAAHLPQITVGPPNISLLSIQITASLPDKSPLAGQEGSRRKHCSVSPQRTMQSSEWLSGGILSGWVAEPVPPQTNHCKEGMGDVDRADRLVQLHG